MKVLLFGCVAKRSYNFVVETKLFLKFILGRKSVLSLFTFEYSVFLLRIKFKSYLSYI